VAQQLAYVQLMVCMKKRKKTCKLCNLSPGCKVWFEGNLMCRVCFIACVPKACVAQQLAYVQLKVRLKACVHRVQGLV
jgi:hypothetical protein